MSKPYVVTFEEMKSKFDSFPQKEYFIKYLERHDCKTVLIEFNYIDKDYIIDYSKFFARSYKHVSRRVKRIHFFSAEFTQEDLEHALNHQNEEHAESYGPVLSNIITKYIGFIILKPLLDDNGQKLLGRTLLKCPCADTETTQFVHKNNKVNLFGIHLQVDTLPFQMQDTAVGGCATSALWVANSKLSELFGTPNLSPFEITEAAVNHVEHNRNFPSQGLTIEQMLNFLRYIKLDYDILDIRKLKSIIGKNEFSDNIINDTQQHLKCLIPDTIKAFINAEIPLICGIRLYKFEDNNSLAEKPFHAIVISGYTEDIHGNISEVYIHDDQKGPYSIATNASADDSFLEWNCKWTEDNEFDKVEVEILIIPTYPKMRTIYNKIYPSLQKERATYPLLEFDLKLYSIQKYKSDLLTMTFDNKINILKKSLPRFVWVLSSYDRFTGLVADKVYDATSHNVEIIEKIVFTDLSYSLNPP